MLSTEINPAHSIIKVCIYGTESTGKSTLTERLAQHYRTEFVPEMARFLIQDSDKCTIEDLLRVAEVQAEVINCKIKNSNKYLFVDTDLNTTRSYSKYLLQKELNVSDWVIKANYYDLYLYLQKDAPYISDVTRIDKVRRDDLDNYHRNELNIRGIEYKIITGNWDERFDKAISIIDSTFC